MAAVPTIDSKVSLLNNLLDPAIIYAMGGVKNSPSLADFNIKSNTGLDVAAAINAAIATIVTSGKSSIFVPPGTYLLNRSTPIIVPAGFTIYGVNGQSIFKGTGTIPNKATFPSVGGSMFCLGNPTTGYRYGTETGRVATGSGLTANLTVTSGAVTGATIVAGGTGWKVGDWAYFSNNTILKITTVATQRGAATAVSIQAAGSGWGTPSNPVSMTSSRGNDDQDRILDPATFASFVCFKDIVIDGNYGYDQTILTGNLNYGGIDIKGCLEAVVTGVKAYRFPNTAILLVDVKRGYVFDNITEDNGWRGVFGTSRNAISNTGIYVTTNPQLNTDDWICSRNVARDVGDVGLQFAFIGNGVVKDNNILGCGTIGIEGEASGYAVLDTFAINGGILIPSDCIVSGNYIDGTMLNGHLATTTTTNPGSYTSTTALDGISWNCGNEGKLEFKNNKIKNVQRYGIKATQSDNGNIVITDNDMDAVNSSPTSGVRQQCIYVQGDTVRVSRNRVRRYGSGSVVSVAQKVSFLAINDNEFENTTSIGGNSGAAILVQIFRPYTTGTYMDISNNKLSYYQTEGVLIDITGNNAVKFSQIKINDNIFREGNRSGPAPSYPYVRVRATSGNKLDFDILAIDGNSVTEASVKTSSSDPIVSVEINANNAAPKLISISRLKAPGFTTKYSIAALTFPATTTATDLNY